MKFCKDCKHFIIGMPEQGVFHLCGHPAVRNPVDGRPHWPCKSLRQLSPNCPTMLGCNGVEIRGHENVVMKVED